MTEPTAMKTIVSADPAVPYGHSTVFTVVEIRINPEQFAEVQLQRSLGDTEAIAKMTASLQFRNGTEAEYKEVYG